MNNSDHFAFHSADVILLLELRKMEFPEGSGLPKTIGHKSGSAETEIPESSFQIQRSQHPPQPLEGPPHQQDCLEALRLKERRENPR